MGEAARHLHDMALEASDQALQGTFGLTSEVLIDPIGPRSADILPFPVQVEGDPEGVITQPLNPETVVIDAAIVRAKLATHNNSMPLDRIRDLLGLAWNQGDVISNRPVPAHLLPFVPDSPLDWYQENQSRIETIIQAAKSSKGIEAIKLEMLIEETKKFEESPFLRHAVRIYKVSQKHPEALRVELAARLILSDAEEEFQR